MARSQPGWQEPPSAREVLELLDGLDERTQAIAVYVHVDGMTHEEAAEVAQVSDRTGRNCLARFAAHARQRAGYSSPGQPKGGME